MQGEDSMKELITQGRESAKEEILSRLKLTPPKKGTQGTRLNMQDPETLRLKLRFTGREQYNKIIIFYIMRILPGAPREFANETPTTAHMSNYLISYPEMLPQVFTAFDMEISAFSSLLARRNMYSGPLALKPESNRNGYKIVGNRKVMWNVKGFSERKIRFVKDAVVSGNAGQYQTIIYIYTDSNWASPKDVLGLADDNRSQLYIAEDRLPEQVEQGCWEYRCKVNT